MERLKVMRAAAALDTFTVEALAAFAGVSIATTQTVISREPAIFERRGTLATGRAGGQPIVWGVVRSALRRLIDEDGAAHPSGEVPLALAAGYDTLLRRLAETEERNERSELLADAAMSLHLAEQEWPHRLSRAADAPRLDLHRRCFAALSRLARLEDAPDAHAWRELGADLARLATELSQQDELALAAAIGVRAMTSRIQRHVCDLARNPRHPKSPQAMRRIETAMQRDLDLASWVDVTGRSR